MTAQAEKCQLCSKTIKGYGHNGSPLVEGKVCDDCQIKVVEARILQAITKGNNMEITISQVRANLFNKQMLGLLVQDYELGMAYDEEHNGFFEQTDEKKAEQIAKHIQSHLGIALYNNVLEIIKGDK